jgi:hypothetical protein
MVFAPKGAIGFSLGFQPGICWRLVPFLLVLVVLRTRSYRTLRDGVIEYDASGRRETPTRPGLGMRIGSTQTQVFQKREPKSVTIQGRRRGFEFLYLIAVSFLLLPGGAH